MDHILEIQRIMLKNQKEIMRKINEYSKKLDTLSAAAPSQSEFFATSTNQDNIFTAIDSVDVLDDFEQDLKDQDKRNALYKKIVDICQYRGETGPYFLIDLMFTRQFIAKCSWSGGSRGDESKIPFKIYNNTINFFQQVTQNFEETFSMVECHKFLKSVLKNALKRSESKGLRASHRKKRRTQLEMYYIDDITDGEYDESGDGLQSIQYSNRETRSATEILDDETNEEHE
ncbi:uncharacterized protein LOC128669864 [Plodia interpunctella]|uniref:uncharacterized protein LOC128669864 n=1 Tax=Plodia interpunctella TaxID=58824 RepID=UPI0023677A1D|nr:uncharacterized protein LOC128669864 [Plodia interpunctella]